MTASRAHSLIAALVAVAMLAGCASPGAPVKPRMDMLGMPVIDDSAMLPHERTSTSTGRSGAGVL